MISDFSMGFASLFWQRMNRSYGNRRVHSLPLAFSKLRARFFAVHTHIIYSTTQGRVCKRLFMKKSTEPNSTARRLRGARGHDMLAL